MSPEGTTPSSISVKRLYEPAEDRDGTRILVDAIWPRGVRRDEWPGRSWRPRVAPSVDLRRWYGHDRARFGEFAARYRAELAENPEVEEILAMSGPLTLVTATRDVEHSHARVLRDHLAEAVGHEIP